MIYTEEVLKALKSFMKDLEAMPDKKDILRNIVTESDYIPIDIIEAKFDRLVYGQYSFRNFRWQIASQKLIGSVELEFYHPVTGNILTRTGAAAISIEQKNLPIGEGKMKTFSFEMVQPALLSICKVSAMRQIGVLFGRSLNRDIVDMALTEKIAKSTELQKGLSELDAMSSVQEINSTKVDLMEKYGAKLNSQEMAVLNKAITDKLIQLIQKS